MKSLAARLLLHCFVQPFSFSFGEWAVGIFDFEWAVGEARIGQF